LLVHIGDPSSNQVTTLESQMIHMIQELFGLREVLDPGDDRAQALTAGLAREGRVAI
jgi:hypothetical protein